MHPGMVKGAMNRTTNLFVLLILISFILPASAIKYAQAATENSQDSDSTGNEQQQNSSTGSGQGSGSSNTGSGQGSGSSNTGSGQESNNAGNEQQQSSSSTENSQQSNNAGNAQESGNTGNEQQQSNNAGNAQQMPGATSPSGSTANTTTSPSGSTANTTTSPSGSTANTTTSPSGSTANTTTSNFTASASNSTGNMSSADFVKGVLALHNRERAAVGVTPLMWSDKLAADARPWAEHVVTIGHMVHDSEHLGTLGEGENIAGYGNPWNPKVGPLTQGGGVNLWIDEKMNWNGGTCASGKVCGHYTQMVWRDTKEVGCATAYGRGIPYSSTALGHVASKPNEFMSILVCRYSPPGNVVGQKPF
jgi:uncharacterized protein YkwD